MEWNRKTCGDFRKGSNPSTHFHFYMKWFINLEKTNTETIDALKSGDENAVFSIPGLSKETFDAEINDWISNDNNKLKVIVLPPTKEGNENQMKWISERIKNLHPSVIILELESKYYKLHASDDYETRLNITTDASESWGPIDNEEFVKASEKTSNEIQYLFLDDILTAGMTGLAVAKKINEFTKNVDFTENADGSHWSKNFRFLCLAKIK